MNGAELRDQGIEQAGSGLDARALVLWEFKARGAVACLAASQSNFTAEDVRREAGEPPTPNAMGAVFRYCYKKGWIRPAGVTTASRPSRHASLLRMWCGV